MASAIDSEETAIGKDVLSNVTSVDEISLMVDGCEVSEICVDAKLLVNESSRRASEEGNKLMGLIVTPTVSCGWSVEIRKPGVPLPSSSSVKNELSSKPSFSKFCVGVETCVNSSSDVVKSVPNDLTSSEMGGLVVDNDGSKEVKSPDSSFNVLRD